MLVRVRSVGAVTSVGVGAAQTDASLRAGLCRFHSKAWAELSEPLVMALVKDAVLADALAAAQGLIEPGWPARLVALAGLALADALAADDAPDVPVALMLGVPDPREGVAAPEGPPLWAAISAAAGCAVDAARSQTFPRGRASIFEAVEAGRALLAQDPQARVVCGGVDSYADAARAAAEVEQGRTLGGDERPTDGRALGEAAGMLVLRHVERGGRGLRIHGLGRSMDPGHRFGTEPARGEGLANAIEVLRRGADPRRPYGAVWAGLTGESHDVKQWGTACLRHRDLLTEDTLVEHPADRLGDTGAALGAMLFVDAHQRLTQGRAPGPALLWASSDHGSIGCATVFVEQG